MRLTETRRGVDVIRHDFEHCQPGEAVVPVPEDPARRPQGARDVWLLRHPGWTAALLNAVGHPPDINYDPQLQGTYDIHLGIRAVDPRMSFAIKLSSDADYTIITAPAATPQRHYDTEFFWRARARMDGERIVLRSTGDKVYLQYLRFTPWVTREVVKLAPAQHVVVCRERGRHFAFPGVAALPDGELLVVCREGVAHVCPFGRIVLIRSRDGGRTWESRQAIYDSPSDDRDPSILLFPDGRLLVAFNTWHSWMADNALRRRYAEQTVRIEKMGTDQFRGSWTIVSEDGGRTWSRPRPAPVFSPHGPVVGRDGKLYYIGSQVEAGKRHVRIFRSADGGATWERHAEVGYSPRLSDRATEEVYDEPNLCQLEDGKWVASMRVELDGYVRLAHSEDGVTWSWPRTTNVRGFPQHLLPLPGGRLLMTYGYRFAPLGVRGCISPDGGRTWPVDEQIVFRWQGGSYDLGYPVSVARADGRIFTVYYYNDGGDCYLEGAMWRP